MHTLNTIRRINRNKRGILFALFLLTSIFAFGVSIETEPTTCEEACDGSATISVTGSGGMTVYIEVNGPDGYSYASSGSSANLSNLCNGGYDVSISTISGCEYEGSFEITSDPGKYQIHFDVEDAVCDRENGSISALAEGPAVSEYRWNTGETGNTLSNVAAGSYSVTATYDNGCSISGGGTVGKENIDLQLDFDSENVTCHGDADGSASVQVSDPTGNAGGGFTCQWSNGQQGMSISGLDGGSYTATCSTEDGCSSSGSVGVREPGELKMSISGGAFQISFCQNADEPELTLTGGASGGTPPYSYSPDPPEKTISSTQTVTMSVTDSVGCSDDASTFVLFIPIVCSRDPNDITGPAGFSENRYIGKQETMPYTIRFENDPEFATAPAQIVYITLPIDEKYDIYSLRLTEFGFGDFSFPINVNQPFYRTQVDVSDSLGVIVDLVAGIDVSKREIFWRLSSLDPTTKLAPSDPQLGFLPINDSTTHAGEGFVNFTIAPARLVETGDSLQAEAIIQFDDNDTIHTNRWVNLVDATSPFSTIGELPEISSASRIELILHGEDADGSGLSAIELFVSVNGAQYELYETVTTGDTTIIFNTEKGQMYSFFTLAVDFAGNREEMKLTPDQTIIITDGILVELSDTICQGDSLLFAGEYLSAPGEYTDTLQTADLNDSIVILNLSVNASFERNVNLFLCQGDSIYLEGRFVSTSGTYTDSLVAWTGCDSIIHTSVQFIDKFTVDSTIIVCEFDSVLINGSYYSENIQITDSLVSLAGCDSVITYSIQVVPQQSYDTLIYVCPGEVYNLHGESITESGTYIDTIPSPNGCGVLVTSQLEFLEVTGYAQNIFVCEGDSVRINDTVVYSSYYSQELFITQYGCDSIVEIDVVFYPSFNNFTESSICSGDSILIAGEYVKEDGFYFDSTNTMYGCDSINTYYVHVLEPVRSSAVYNICAGDSVLIGENYVFTNGTFQTVFQSESGCDSIITSIVRVFQENMLHDTIVAICQGESYFAEGMDRTESGTYTDTISIGGNCEGVVLTMLEVNPVYEFTVDTTLCAGNSIIIGRDIVTENGMYTQYETSVSGCDSTYVWNINFIEPAYDTVTVAICSGDSYLAGGEQQSEPGLYIDILNGTEGCPNYKYTQLLVNDSYSIFEELHICSGDTVSFMGTDYFNEGIYIDSLLTTMGCDSIFTVAVIETAPTVDSIDVIVCTGSEYAIGDSVYTQSGLFTHVFEGEMGCDSIVVVNLLVQDIFTRTHSVEICKGETFFAEGLEQTEPGLYYDTIAGGSECDTVHITALTVREFIVKSQSATICFGDSYVFNGTELTEAGLYETRESVEIGCDTITQLELVVLNELASTQNVAVCEGQAYEIGLSVYTEAGLYTDTLVSSTGCDSVVHTNLTIVQPEITEQEVEACSELGYFVGGELQFNPGTYTDTISRPFACDSISITTLSFYDYEEIPVRTIACIGDSLLVMNEYIHQSGVYYDTVEVQNACDIVYIINFQLLPEYVREEAAAICEGDSLFAQGQYQYSSGSFRDTAFYNDVCDTIDIIHLTVNPVYSIEATMEICLGDTIFVADTFVVQNSILVDHLISSVGCDSIVTTHVFVHEHYETNYDTTIYEGDSIYFAGSYISQEGIYIDTLETEYSCDSIVTFELFTIVNEPPVVTSIAKQLVSSASPTITINLNNYVEDDHASDSELEWRVTSSSSHFTVRVSAAHVLTITLRDTQWRGTETIRLLVTDDGGKSSIMNIEVESKGQSSIIQLNNDVTVVVYPNPNKGRFKLEIETSVEFNADIILTDAAGKTLDKKSVDVQANHSEEYKLKKNTSGIIYLNIITDSFHITEEIIVVQ